MKLASFQFKKYCFPTTKSIQLKSGLLTSKKVFFVTAKTDCGKTMSAEISSLLGVHSFSLLEAKKKISFILDHLKKNSFSRRMRWDRPFFGVFNSSLPYSSLPPPQVLFPIESLLLGLYRQQFLEDFNLSSRLSVNINRLFVPCSFEISQLSHVKILKVKLSSLKQSQKLIKKLLKKNSNLKLRLDLNQGWTPFNVRKLVSVIPNKNLEYIEDPYKNLSKSLKQFNDFPLALDKELAHILQKNKFSSFYKSSSWKWNVKHFNFPSNTRVLVVKPSRDLSISGSIFLIKKLRSKKIPIQVVISNAYETPIGLWSLAHLAKVSQVPAGLDTQKVFRQTTLNKHLFHPTKINQLTIRSHYLKKFSLFSISKPLLRM